MARMVGPVAVGATRPERSEPALGKRRDRTVVLIVGLACLVAKTYIAAITFGTNDVRSWMNFAEAINKVGPIRVYGYPFPHDLYNHPPLVGYLLMALNYVSRVGLPLKLTLRSCSSLADVATALIVYELVRRRRSPREAVASGILVAASPILFIVSGFHGNTDPIFVMLCLLGLFLLVDRSCPLQAGLIMAMSVSIKLVPVLVIPSMLAYAYRRGMFVRFATGLVGLTSLIWVPALIVEWTPIRHNVLGYTGIGVRWWGIPQFASWAGWSGAGNVMAARGSLLLVAVIAGTAAVATLRKPSLVVEAGASTLCCFLLLSPASGTQYLVWAMAPAYLIGFARATAFNLSGGAWLFSIYTRWSGGFPWNVANGSPPTTDQRLFGCVVWVALLTVVLRGISGFVASRGEASPQSADYPPKRDLVLVAR